MDDFENLEQPLLFDDDETVQPDDAPAPQPDTERRGVEVALSEHPEEEIAGRVDDVLIPVELPILPLKDVVIYPFSGQPLAVGQERSIKLINDAIVGNRLVGFVAQKDSTIEGAGPEDAFRIGTVGMILGMRRMANGTMQLAVQGLERMEIDEYTQIQPYLKARISLAPDDYVPSVEVDALARNLMGLFQRLIDLLPHLPDELGNAAQNVDNPRQLAYLIATTLRMPLDLRQDILETEDVRGKLEKLTGFLSHELEVLELGKKLQSQVQGEVERTQQEYLLREQLKAIQRELGESSAEETEVNELRAKIDASAMPEEARTEALRELDRLERLPAAAAEYGVIKSYLDWMVSMPWGVYTEGELDIEKTRTILDEDHYDLEKIKERILEYLAVRKLKPSARGRPKARRPRADPVLRRAAGRGQDQPGPVASPAPWAASSRACRWAACTTRPRSAATAAPTSAPCRAASSRPSAAPGRRPGLHAGRDGQAGQRFPRRPVVGAARSARPGAEQRLPRPLSRRAVRPVAGACSSPPPTCSTPIPPPLRDRMEILVPRGYTEEEKLAHRPALPGPASS